MVTLVEDRVNSRYIVTGGGGNNMECSFLGHFYNMGQSLPSHCCSNVGVGLPD